MEYSLICSWSCIIIFVWMVRVKYYWTLPPFKLCVLFILFGIGSTLPALLCNIFLSRETEFWVYSPNRFYSFMGFFVGAGMSEEFWKMSFGVILIFILLGRQKRIRETDCVIGFVSLGLAFAAVENFISYIHLEIHLLISRGLISVPLHAGMGMIHGLAVNRARNKKSVVPLLTGYFRATVLHTICDTWGLFISQSHTRLAMIFMSIVLMIWCINKWKKLPEVSELEYVR